MCMRCQVISFPIILNVDNPKQKYAVVGSEYPGDSQTTISPDLLPTYSPSISEYTSYPSFSGVRRVYYTRMIMI